MILENIPLDTTKELRTNVMILKFFRKSALLKIEFPDVFRKNRGELIRLI